MRALWPCTSNHTTPSRPWAWAPANRSVILEIATSGAMPDSAMSTGSRVIRRTWLSVAPNSCGNRIDGSK